MAGEDTTTEEAHALVEAARSGDAGALEELMRRSRTTVVRYAVRLCISPEDAEDAAQEALVALSRHITALREAAALSSWLFRAVRTHCTRLARRSLRRALVLDAAGEAASEALSPEDQLVDAQLRTRLSVVMSGLAPVLRDVLVRADVEGKALREIAEELGLTLEATKSRLHRARAEVKASLLASLEVRPLRRPVSIS